MSLLCFRLLEMVLGYINAVAQSMERNADKLTGKFWRALLSKAYDMLDKVGVYFSVFCVLLLFYVTVKLFNRKFYFKSKLSNSLTEGNPDFSWKRIS